VLLSLDDLSVLGEERVRRLEAILLDDEVEVEVECVSSLGGGKVEFILLRASWLLVLGLRLEGALNEICEFLGKIPGVSQACSEFPSPTGPVRGSSTL
jgi:hypothetical protein